MRAPPESIQKIREEQGIKLPAGIELVPLAGLQANPRNARIHSEDQIGRICKSLQAFGWTKPIIVSEDGKTILAGHGLAEAARRLGMEKVPVIMGAVSGKLADAYMVADNRLSDISEDSPDLLKNLLQELDTGDMDMSITGFTEAELEQMMTAVYQGEEEAPLRVSLAERFGIPPFSILDARQGYWQARKKAWLALGIKSEIGRGEALLGISEQARSKYAQVRNEEAFLRIKPAGRACGNSSIFDPVLCEMAYRWFSPPGGEILDPFAGGSVRGIVAAKLGREYTGIDLSAAQIEANREQAKGICNGSSPAPAWIEGDSLNVKTLAPREYDFLFSCPPYFDLEVYSDDPRDLSVMEYPVFLKAYREIIAASVSMLKQDRFACFAVGDIRDKKGILRNFVSDTIAAFQDAGMRLYNEAILITVIGSLPIRVRRQFEASRKLGKTHQNVLVFVKGDPKKATEAVGPVEFGEIEGMEEEAGTE